MRYHPHENNYYLHDIHLTLLQDAYYNSHMLGIFSAAAAGNVLLDEPGLKGFWPAKFRHLVTATSDLGCDGVQDNSFYEGLSVDLAAPGQGYSEEYGSRGQIVTTKRFNDDYAIDDDELYGGTSSAVAHLGGVAALLLSYEPDLTNEDIAQVLQNSAMDLGDPGWDEEYGWGLIRIDRALQSLEDYELVHDSTTSVTSYSLITSCREQTFKNVPIQSMAQRTDYFVDLYRFDKVVSLSANVDTSHVPDVWVRGRGSLAAADSVDYDAHFFPNMGEVVSRSSTQATLRGYTYKIYKDLVAPCDSVLAWFPLTLPVQGMSPPVVFQFSYLADTSAPRPAPPVPALSGLALRSGALFSRPTGDFLINYRSPGGQRGSLKVYDSNGRLLRALTLVPTQHGWNTAIWDGRNESGRKVPSGIYLGKLKEGRDVAKIRFFPLH